LKAYTFALIAMMMLTRIGSIKVIIMLTVPESMHRNNGSTRSRRETGHTNRHRSRKGRSILSRLRISNRRASISRLIADRGGIIRRLIANRGGTIRRLIADRLHNGRNRSHDRCRYEHFNLIVVVVTVMVIVMVVAMVVIVVMVVTMVVIVVFAYFDVNMTTSNAKADRFLFIVMMSVVIVMV